MSTPGPSAGGEGAARLLRRASTVLLYGAVLWPALASGAYRGWPLALTQLLVLGALLGWTLAMLAARRFERRPTALDLPLLCLALLFAAQVALGSGPLVTWALSGPPPDPAQPAALPTPILAAGTVSRVQTVESLLLFLTYAAVYGLVVNLIRRRVEVDRLVRTLVIFGGAVAFLSLLDYLARESWLFWWREGPRVARLAGPFVNPDHFAAWLVMLTCLGAGYLAARRAAGRHDAPWRTVFRSREAREATIRRSLPAVGVGLTVLAAIFTLSRGALLSLVIALLAAFAVRRLAGRLGGGGLAAGTVAAAVLGAAIWIGLDPLVARVGGTDHVKRWIQWASTLPMLGAFPVLGVGLGAYKDAYFRFQPASLEPGQVYFPYAHNDLLQFVVETGLPGAALLVFAIARIGRDLIGAHLLGQGRCPAGGGVGDEARRHHGFSVGVAVGALAAVLALLIHSLLDFSARIPADGVLAAACLGIATVVLHTRFTPEGEEDLVAARSIPVTGRTVPVATAAVALALAVAVVLIVPALSESRLARAAGPDALRWADQAVAGNPWSVRALRVRADLKLEAARQLWRGQAADEAARARAAILAGDSIGDLRAALALRPTEPFLHESLGVAYATQASLDSVHASELRARALAHLARAIALAPESPSPYRSLAVVAISGPEARLDLGLGAAREAVGRDPGLLSELVDRLLPLRLSSAQWLMVVPASETERLRLGDALERRGLLGEAAAVYAATVGASPGSAQPLARWIFACLLLRTLRFEDAVAQAEAGLARDPDNPELQLARADGLAGHARPAALAAYEGALRAAEALSLKGARAPFPAALEDSRLRALVTDRLDGAARVSPLRYRRALARYLTAQKMWGPALVEWERVLAEAPEDALGHFSRGLVLDAHGRADEAIDEYRKAVSLDGRAVAYRQRFAQRLWDTEQFYQAINEWQTLTGLQPDNLQTRLALARAYARVGERDRAARELEQILARAPGQAEARQALARLRQAP